RRTRCTRRRSRLYELEDQLAGTEFIRASKQLLANFDHVKAIPARTGRPAAAAARQRRGRDRLASVRARHQAQARL
ncbi:LytTR family transcriptional regulator DNA-binding domain-containing protein, partial [Eggerthella sinensis]|uniref:LytTR family transcriptional regulator DNA-binding domain-containing protein n=1 Tax=Eggerthella sinensis TaxID=242230 RepID=UPI0022E969B2